MAARIASTHHLRQTRAPFSTPRAGGGGVGITCAQPGRAAHHREAQQQTLRARGSVLPPAVRVAVQHTRLYLLGIFRRSRPTFQIGRFPPFVRL